MSHTGESKRTDDVHTTHVSITAEAIDEALTGDHGSDARVGGGRGHGTGGPGAHHGHHVEMFRRRFWWSLVLTVPLVVTSHMVMDWFGYELDFPGIEWVGPVLGTILFVWGGQPFLTGGWHEARARTPGMMLLIAMAITVAFGASLASALDLFDMDLWWELALLIDIMLLGHWMEMRAVGQARGALQALAELLPDDAERVTDDATETVPIGDLEPGDLVLVRPGGRVPADGTIESGGAEFDESMITGESRPVRREQQAIASWPGRSPPTARSVYAWTPSATTPRSPGSSVWSPRPSPRTPVPRRSPTGQPHCCSTSPSRRRAITVRRRGWLLGNRRATPRYARSSRCWSSPARTHSGWRFPLVTSRSRRR
jgi:hypothetical protein